MVYVPVVGATPAKYLPDSPILKYAPKGVVGNPFQRMRIWLPDPARFPRPPRGYPVVPYTPFGGFASVILPTEIADPSTSVASQNGVPGFLWMLLEHGVALCLIGVTGSDTASYAPGGAFYSDPTKPKLSQQVPGNGTFDWPGSTTPDYDHHDVAGMSLDGGLTYPHDTFPVPVKDFQWGVQKLRRIGHAYGVRTKRLFGGGRSAGSLVAGALAAGPDYRDSTMVDHRSESSALQGILVWASSCWIPAWQTNAANSPPCLYFPRATNPNATAQSLADAPAIWPREASFARIGTRSPEVRAANAVRPWFIVNLDPEANLALVNLTPTQAVVYQGDDASNNRLPAMSNEISGAVAHPGIQGPLWRVRLRELNATFHAAKSRLYITDAGRNALAGHTTQDGFPLVDLITATQEDLLAISTYQPGRALAQGIKAQYDAWDAEDAPIEVQPELRRKLVRKAAVELLKGKTACGNRVFSTRVSALQPNELPALCVYTETETTSILTESPRVYLHRIELRVEIHAAESLLVDDRLDDIAFQVRAAIELDEDLNGYAQRIEYQGTESGWDDEGARPTGALRIRYEVQVEEAIQAPTNLDPFQKAFVQYDLALADGTIDAEDLVYPEQLEPEQ